MEESMDTNLYYVLGLVITIIFFVVIPKIKKEQSEETVDFESKLNEVSTRIEKNFEAITNKSLAQNAEFVQNLSTSGVDLVLRPLVEQLKDYEKKMDQMVKDETYERTTLKEMIKCVNEINQGFSEEAKRFVVAVRGNIHAAGNWGEDTLQNILDSSGLNEGKDYDKQRPCKTSDGGNIRPDFILRAPQNRAVVIDSKLSLDAFMRYIELSDEKEKKQAAKDLIRNINNHANDLSNKQYQEIVGVNSFDYVLMFISSDAALSTALSFDKELIRNALAKNILIVGPTTLMATLKTIQFLWQEQKQMENFKEIGNSGKRLYEKLYHFLERMHDVQKSFDKANDSLGVAFNHLNRGEKSLINEANNLKNLGISSEKDIKANKNK